jgi:hypothetical protein
VFKIILTNTKNSNAISRIFEKRHTKMINVKSHLAVIMYYTYTIDRSQIGQKNMDGLDTCKKKISGHQGSPVLWWSLIEQ